MRTPFLWGVIRFMALLLVLYPTAMVRAQSAADQAIKTLPQQMKDNSENRVVTKSNTVSNNAMNKLDSAGNKAFKGVTGIFKKKKKKPGGDSTAVHSHPADSTAAPKTSSFIPRPKFFSGVSFVIGLPRPVERWAFNNRLYFLNVYKETYQS